MSNQINEPLLKNIKALLSFDDVTAACSILDDVESFMAELESAMYLQTRGHPCADGLSYEELNTWHEGFTTKMRTTSIPTMTSTTQTQRRKLMTLRASESRNPAKPS